jgi:hypothetical protein
MALVSKPIVHTRNSHAPSSRKLHAAEWATSRVARCAIHCLMAALAPGLPACLTAHAVSSSGPSAGSHADVTPIAPIAAAPTESAPAPPEDPPKALPRGGQRLFPAYRLVGYCGTPGAPALGEMQGNLHAKAKALETKAGPYAQNREILPVFELIAVVVQDWPGPDGKYRRRVDDSVVDQYLRAARQSRALLFLNIQPGQSDFLTEVKTFEKYLQEPDVGVALDPEWAMKPKQRPGQFFGQTTGATINDVAAYLSRIVTRYGLPEKALVFHEVVRTVVKDEAAVTPYPGVVLIKSVDGLGPVAAKIATYGNLMEKMPAGVHPGFKLFFDEDTRNGSRIMTAKEVLNLSPEPEYVMYE